MRQWDRTWGRLRGRMHHSPQCFATPADIRDIVQAATARAFYLPYQAGVHILDRPISQHPIPKSCTALKGAVIRHIYRTGNTIILVRLRQKLLLQSTPHADRTSLYVVRAKPASVCCFITRLHSRHSLGVVQFLLTQQGRSAFLQTPGADHLHDASPCGTSGSVSTIKGRRSRLRGEAASRRSP